MRNALQDVFNFDLESSIPDLSNKVILVTGANAGIGKATIIEIAKHNPKRLYASARSRIKFNVAFNDVNDIAPNANIEFLEMDLSSLRSVNAAANKILAENDRLDIIINNAGIMAVPHKTTIDGYEIQFATNHMGHALLVSRLLGLLQKTAALPDSDVRIVNVSSAGHFMAPGKGIVFDKLRTSMKGTHEYAIYGQSKLANVLHAKELARRYPNITSVSIHPGRVGTSLLDHYEGPMAVFQKVYDWMVTPFTPEQGALNQIWAAFGKKSDIKSGSYYTPVGKITRGDCRALDGKIAAELWNWQETEFDRLGYSSQGVEKL
jgi:NAD(P)-dependent dehydrogenase (short-subunit alcohol dehydrogenase family)